MITEQQLSTVIGSTAHGADGKIGTVGEVYLDDETGRPEWATVRTGLFGTKESFVPLAEADLSGSDLRLPYDTDKIKHAPKIEKALARSRPWKRFWMNPETCGVMMPPPKPCTTRAREMTHGLGAAPAAALDRVKSATPATNIIRRPRASPRRPAGTRTSPKVSA